MDDYLEKLKLWDCKLPRWLGILLLLLVVGEFVLLIIFGVRDSSNVCKDSLRAEQECRNITHLLQHQLTQAQEVVLETEAQAASCNKTVVTLMESLEKEKAQGHKQQELVQELQEEIEKLKQELQDTGTELELERLRKKDESWGLKTNSNSGNILRPLAITVLLTLCLRTLLA
uniref:BST-2 n=1 Tax=Taphozous melanopogon TaxID=187003 RepID=A0A8F2Z0U5_TAPME|nr:BST-2 [Taphozous melanopogon]